MMGALDHKRIVPPEPDAERRWRRLALRYLVRGLPAVVLLAAVLYGAAAALYRVGALFGPAGVLAAEALTIALAGPPFFLILIGLAPRLRAGARGLVLPEALAPPALLTLPRWGALVMPVLWVALWSSLLLAGLTEPFEQMRGRPAMAVGIGVMATGMMPTMDLLRLPRAQILGADAGAEPADFSIRDRLCLMLVSHRLSTSGFLAALPVYLAAMLLLPSLAVLTLLPAAWGALLA